MAIWIECARDMQTLSANGTSLGYITVPDIRRFFVGAIVWLKDNDTAPARYKVTELAYTTAPAGTIRLRAFPANPGTDANGYYSLNQISYGHSDVSAYTTAQGAVVTIHKQLVRVEPDYLKPGLKI